jgi:hypothetical protein
VYDISTVCALQNASSVAAVCFAMSVSKACYNIHVISPSNIDSRAFFDAARSEIQSSSDSVHNFFRSSLWVDGAAISYSLFRPISPNSYLNNCEWARPYAFVIVYDAHSIDGFTRATKDLVEFVAERMRLVGNVDDEQRCVGALVANVRGVRRCEVPLSQAREVATALGMLFYDVDCQAKPKRVRAIVHSIVRGCDQAFARSLEPPPQPAADAVSSASLDTVLAQASTTVQDAAASSSGALLNVASVGASYVLGCANAVAMATLFSLFSLASICAPTSEHAAPPSSAPPQTETIPVAHNMADFERMKADPRRSSVITAPRQRTPNSANDSHWTVSLMYH